MRAAANKMYQSEVGKSTARGREGFCQCLDKRINEITVNCSVYTHRHGSTVIAVTVFIYFLLYL